MNEERKNILLRAVILCLAVFVLLWAGMKTIDRMQQNQYRETRNTGTDEFMQSNVTLWKGERYRKTPAMTTVLIAGIDRDADAQTGVSTSRYRDGGQADFLLLLAIDHTNRQIHQLQIDRDTMAEVIILSVYGKETGVRTQQICLAHNYGANKEENAAYTVKAARKLMDGMDINNYYMVDYSAVNVLNEILGGVTVTVPDDMTSVNAAWEKGKSVILTGTEAETFVRTRKTVGEGTNEERMRRQNAFMQSAVTLMRSRLSKDPSFANSLLTALKKNAATNFSDQQLLEEIQVSADYEILPVEYLDGVYKIGENGYIEFYANDESAENWIMNHLYTKYQ